MNAIHQLAGLPELYVPNTPETRRRFLDDVLPRLHAYAPAPFPQWDHKTSLADLESMAARDFVAGEWLPKFLAWRHQVLLLEQENVSRVAVLLGALRHATALEDWEAQENVMRRLVADWGLFGDAPVDAVAQRGFAEKLAAKKNRLRGRLRSHAWAVPAAAREGKKGNGL